MPILTISNTARGQRGVHTVDGLVMLDPGESRPLELTEAQVENARDTAGLSFDAPAASATGESAQDDLESKSIAQLKALAAEKGIVLPETGTGDGGRVLKRDIIAAIKNPTTAPEPQGDALDQMNDDELRATVQALTGAEAPADATRADLLAQARGV